MARNTTTRFTLTGTLRCATPLHVGGFGDDPDTDLPLARDGLGCCYIPGTSLAGALRQWCRDAFGRQPFDPDDPTDPVNAVWGYQNRSDSTKGHASYVTVDDLLSRTVLYKVGHHASHNATLCEGGLEKMTHPDLIAVIPVNEDFAVNSKHWKMPAQALYARLQERAHGRVLRADKAWPQHNQPNPSDLTELQWSTFVSQVQVSDLFIELTL